MEYIPSMEKLGPKICFFRSSRAKKGLGCHWVQELPTSSDHSELFMLTSPNREQTESTQRKSVFLSNYNK